MTLYFTEEQDRQWRAEQPKKMIGVKVVVKSSDGRVLVVKPTYKPTWQLPGGVVEAGEDPKEAAKRELQEETAIVCGENDLKLIDLVFRADQDVLLLLYELLPMQDSEQKITVQDTELETYEWIAPQDVPARLPDYYSASWQTYTKYAAEQ
jgi:8-oxo-dGTP pyrophosphatase MutT (NUDIX family)